MGNSLVRVVVECTNTDETTTRLVNKPEDKKPLLCTVVSMILKKRRNSMALVQKAVSVVLYGNGVGKKVQIYTNFFFYLIL